MRIREYLSPFSTGSIVHAQYMEDVENPHFMKQKEAGTLFSNPMLRVEYVGRPHESGTYTYRHWYNGRFVRYETETFVASRVYHPNSYYWTSQLFTAPFNIGNVVGDNQALADVLQTSVSAKVGSGTTQSLVSLTEARKTGSMLGKAGRLLLRPLSDARKLLRLTRSAMQNPDDAKRVFNLASDLWLEARYGWRPFIYDVFSHVDATLNPYENIRRTFRASTKLPFSGPSSTTKVLNAGGGIDGIGLFREVKLKSFLRVGQTADYRAAISLPLLQYGGYDWLGTAWELIPYSFVVDHFINIGDNLQSLQAYALVHERVGWSTFQVEVDVTSTVGPLGVYYLPNARGYIDWVLPPNTPTCVERLVWKRRAIPTSFLPSVSLKFNVDLPFVVDLALLLKNLTRYR